MDILSAAEILPAVIGLAGVVVGALLQYVLSISMASRTAKKESASEMLKLYIELERLFANYMRAFERNSYRCKTDEYQLNGGNINLDTAPNINISQFNVVMGKLNVELVGLLITAELEHNQLVASTDYVSPSHLHPDDLYYAQNDLIIKRGRSLLPPYLYIKRKLGMELSESAKKIEEL